MALETFCIVCIWILIILTVVGNAVTLFVILARKKTRNSHGNRFLLSLSAADFSVGLFVMLPGVLRIMYGGWMGGLTSCKIYITADIAFCSASIYSLIGISLDRHYAVYHPLQYAIKRKLRTVTIMILSAWVMGLIISTPMYIDAPGFSNFAHIMNETTIKNNSLGGCMPPVDHDSRGFVLYSSILAFIIPAFILGGLQASIMYRKMIIQRKRVERSKEQAQAENAELTRQATVLDRQNTIRDQDSIRNPKKKLSTAEQPKNVQYTQMEESTCLDDDESHSTDFNQQEILELQQKDGSILGGILSIRKPKRELTKAERKLKKEETAQRRITTMMAVIVGTFALCWFPFAVMFIVFPYSDEAANFLVTNPWLIDLITWIGYVNSSLNPMIYAIMNPEIKKGMLRLIGKGDS
eukprot:GFUD01076448.1.p1 GENE.GFUD01076448.1~~GFUD01076448.1.p1  ORF type:complete len:410 (-),score=81.96 GFUD01076448.1:117-1346(-)